MADPPKPSGLYRGPVTERQARTAVPPEPGSSPEAVSVPKPTRTPESRRSVFARADLPTLWAAAGRWSPAGIAAALLLVFLALGGREGVVGLVKGLSDSVSQARELQGEIAAVRTEMAALRSELTAERKERDKLSAGVERNGHNVRLVCDLASRLNHGRPNDSWCSLDGLTVSWEQPPPGGDRIPLHKTAALYQHP